VRGVSIATTICSKPLILILAQLRLAVFFWSLQMEYGFVYVMQNESMPNLFKIGHTLKSPMQRAIDLTRHSGVPNDFEVLFYCECIDPNKFEFDVHRILDEKRYTSNREFFKLSINELKELANGLKSFGDNFCSTYLFRDLIKAETK
jgi:hypothetical protein